MSKSAEHRIAPLTDIVNGLGDLDAFRRAVSCRRGKFNLSSKKMSLRSCVFSTMPMARLAGGTAGTMTIPMGINVVIYAMLH